MIPPASRTPWLGVVAMLLAGRAVGADGLWTSKPEGRPAVSIYGVMVEARNFAGMPDRFNPYNSTAAQLFREFLPLPERSPSLGVIGIKGVRRVSTVAGRGGLAVSAYLVRLGPGGPVAAGPQDIFETNWCFGNRLYALGVPPGTYAVAAITADATEDHKGRGLYFHRNFYLKTADLLSTSVVVGAGQIVYTGEVAFKSPGGDDPSRLKDKGWRDEWQARGRKRNINLINVGGFWVYQASIPEHVGFDTVKIQESFAKSADPVQLRMQGLINAASGFPLSGLAESVEVDRSPRELEWFAEKMKLDLDPSPWGEHPEARRDGQPPVAAAIVSVASAPGVVGGAMAAPTAAAPADALYAEAAAFYQAKEYDNAWRKAVEALRVDPRHWKSWALIGNCQLAKGDKAGAIKSYRTALDLNPDNPPLRAWMEKNGK